MRKSSGNRVNRIDEIVAEVSDMLGAATLAEEEELFRQREEEEQEEEDDTEYEGAEDGPYYGPASTLSAGQSGQVQPIVEVASSTSRSESAADYISPEPGPSRLSHPATAPSATGTSNIQPGPRFSWVDDVEESELF